MDAFILMDEDPVATDAASIDLTDSATNHPHPSPTSAPNGVISPTEMRDPDAHRLRPTLSHPLGADSETPHETKRSRQPAGREGEPDKTLLPPQNGSDPSKADDDNIDDSPPASPPHRVKFVERSLSEPNDASSPSMLPRAAGMVAGRFRTATGWRHPIKSAFRFRSGSGNPSGGSSGPGRIRRVSRRSMTATASRMRRLSERTFSTVAEGDENPERGTWSNQFEFFLSCLGYAVGLGNVWRFPYLCHENGGGAFLIPYIIMLLLCGLPMLMLELSLGQYSSEGPITIWKISPLFKGIGVGMVMISIALAAYYNMITGWAIYYLYTSLNSTLPWSCCQPPWASPDCVTFSEDPACSYGSITGRNQTNNATTTMEFRDDSLL